MNFFKKDIPGVFLIAANSFIDERGVFRRHFCSKEFKKAGISAKVQQANVSENKEIYTLRGFHYQISPFREGKTLSCLKGSIYDVVVDLRPESPTYMKWESFILDDINRNSIHIPPGCANAFLTMKSNCLIHYYCSEYYESSAERGIRYNDPAFKFKWPHEPKVISNKDLNHPNYLKI